MTVRVLRSFLSERQGFLTKQAFETRFEIKSKHISMSWFAES